LRDKTELSLRFRFQGFPPCGPPERFVWQADGIGGTIKTAGIVPKRRRAASACGDGAGFVNGGSEKPQDLKPRTKAFALRVIRIYSALPPEAITAAMDELARDRSAMIPGLPFYLKWPVYCSVKHSI
jgi:hypothetical protein